MRYTGTHWERTTDAAVGEQVRLAVIELHAAEAHHGADADRLKSISGLFAAHRIRAVTGLAKGILEVRADEFDAHPDLLNVGNGVIDLESGVLTPHDPKLMLTRHTSADYQPDTTHPDWDTALTALHPETAKWLQQRFGQAATGHPTPDDIMPTLQGSGANGKTTVLTPVMRALGDYAVPVPERVLLANPSDHPTELMTLRGARLAVMEETPETRHLNVKRLKDTLGTETMTARHIGKDTVSWSPTHSLVLSTNYRPRVDETDHGTWRRLTLVRFRYTFRKPGEPHTRPFDRDGDPTLRDRLKQGRGGRREAVLAWIVRGAVDWYRNGCVLLPPPANVAADTRAWREDSDAILAFVTESLVFEDGWHVMSTDLLREFNNWLKARGHREWSDQTLNGRLKDHDAWQRVEHRKVLASKAGRSRPGWVESAVPKQYHAWLGVRFRTHYDDIEADENTQDGRGGQGGPELQLIPIHEQPLECPVHPVQSDGAGNGTKMQKTPGADGQADQAANAVYRNGLCHDCHSRSPSAGRTRCEECHRIHLIVVDGYDR